VLNCEFDRAAIDRAMIDGVLSENGLVRKSAVDEILEAMSQMAEYKIVQRTGEDGGDYCVEEYQYYEHLGEGVNYVKKDPFLHLHLESAHPLFLKWARLHGYDGDILSITSFRAQLKRADYYVDKKLMDFGDKKRNGWILDLSKMEALNLATEWQRIKSEDGEF